MTGPSVPIPKGVNRSYVALLNEDIQDFYEHLHPRVQEKEEDHLDVELNATVPWNDEELDLLYRGIERFGSHNCRDLASYLTAAGRSRSEIEVASRIALHDRGLEQVIDRPSSVGSGLPVPPPTVPIALELSNALTAALAEEAARCERQCLEKEEAEENARFGSSMWRLDVRDAIEWEESLEGEDGECDFSPLNRPELSELIPVNWILLMERVYMNGATCDGRYWQESIEERSPGIRIAALQDFRQIMRDITSRLISAAILVCGDRRERCNNMAEPREIERRDVKEAIKLLNLPSNTMNYWQELPRRLGLTVLKKRRSCGQEGNILAYDEAERRLIGSSVLSSVQHDLKVESVSFRRGQVPPSTVKVDDEASGEVNKGRFLSQSDRRAMRRIRKQTAFLESRDADEAKAAERELWKMLNKDDRNELDRSGGEDRPGAGWRRAQDERFDWRLVGDYRAEWESRRSRVEENHPTRSQATDTQLRKLPFIFRPAEPVFPTTEVSRSGFPQRSDDSVNETDDPTVPSTVPSPDSSAGRTEQSAMLTTPVDILLIKCKPERPVRPSAPSSKKVKRAPPKRIPLKPTRRAINQQTTNAATRLTESDLNAPPDDSDEDHIFRPIQYSGFASKRKRRKG